MNSSMQELNMEEMNEVSGGLVWLLVLGGAALLAGCGKKNTPGTPGDPGSSFDRWCKENKYPDPCTPPAEPSPPTPQN